MYRIVALSLLAVLGASMFAQSTGIPSFAQFPADPFTGKPVPAVLATPGQRQFRTRIRERAAQGPNFAGHFTIADWGCGTSCKSGVLVDARTGKVYDVPFGILGYGQALKYADGSETGGLDYRLDSRLLIARGCPEDENCGA